MLVMHTSIPLCYAECCTLYPAGIPENVVILLRPRTDFTAVDPLLTGSYDAVAVVSDAEGVKVALTLSSRPDV